MPLRFRQRILESLGKHLIILLVAAFAMAMPVITDSAIAQEGYPRPPLLAPDRPSLFQGALYVEAGTRFRNLNTVSLVLPSNGEVKTPFTDKIWTPFFEMGYQESNFFDIFCGFSWYSVAHSRTLANSVVTWHMDMYVYEFRNGFRSWFPLYGFGRIATKLGFINAIVPYEVNVINGQLAGNQEDWWWHFAGFGGIELEVDYSRFFAKGSAEYSYGTTETYGALLDTDTIMAPCGFAFTISGGMRF